VRDFQKSSGKKINFFVSGDEYEVDKSILEMIADPLVHLLRNAIDHGLETPEERIKADKPETGQIRLQASQTGTEVWITITDDGCGLNKDKILQKAVEKGILESMAVNMPDAEIYDLIFIPGLSTSKAITEISGRGVGMDIVKQNISRLNGRIDITSKKGAGTCFQMKIPLLAGIMEGTVFRVGNMHFALQTVEIQELVKMDQSLNINLVEGLDMVYVRKEHIPVFEIGEIIDLPGRIMGNSSPGLLIIIEYENAKIALKVDAILGNHSLIIKPMGSILKGAHGISGFSIMGNGNVCIILDVKSIYDFFIKKAREVELIQNTTIGKILQEKGVLVP
jgi:two-component system chemotaxis sensor kinase CheA